MIYDIIGDIHGQYHKLTGLLDKLGYRHNGQFYEAPAGHKACFLGDFVDRGSHQRQTLELIFAMLDNAQAYAVIGNHEYNAIAYATIHNGQYLRDHNLHNTQQHQAFLDEIAFGGDEHRYWLKRFYQLPLWLEFDNFCMVHACWDGVAMANLAPYLTANNCLDPKHLAATATAGSTAYNALENILKGLEGDLPQGQYFLDKNNVKRTKTRLRWWDFPLSHRPINDIAHLPSHYKNRIGKQAVGQIDFEITHNKPIFVGHYWLDGTPQILSQQVVCVDYSAGADGFLSAYRFDSNNPVICNENFVQYQAN